MPVRSWLAHRFLSASGWTLVGNHPASRRYVLIAAPHTSNWDLLFMLALAWSAGIRLSWMGKHTLFLGPCGRLARWLGGIPVRRHAPENVVDQMTRAFEEQPGLVLAIAPEATRSYGPHWKSGFYRIALAAQVPIVMGFLDYGHKRGGFGPELIPTGDLREDMEEIRHFYVDKIARFPEATSEIRLKEEM
ncbi:lysophospholipid acyltransferase family protein [Myxococcota bacterium]|nr:lysophospholipid acyltransferase family protein [Myxococcota bacterium]